MIRITHLTKQYQSKHNTVTAIHDLSLSIGERGLVFLVGRSGCGKTTLLNLIGGMDAATSGEITVDGRSLSQFTQRDFDAYRNTMVGFVFQDFNLIEELTVAKNIALALELQGQKPAPAAIEQVLSQVELDGMGGRYPKELSGGQKQRAAIARALIKKPRILLADEPTGALDETTGRQILELLKTLSRDTLILIVSHDRDFAGEYGDRIIELADGKLLSDTATQTDTDTAPPPVIKSRLKIGTTFKLALHYLASRKLRAAVVALLSVAALLMVGMTDLISAYDKQTAIISSLYENQTPYVTLLKEKNINEAWYDNSFKLSDADIQKLAEQTGQPTKGIYIPSFTDLSLENNYGSTHVMNEHYGEYVPALSGLIEFTEQDMSDFGFTMMAGRLPEKEYELVLTDYVYHSFLHAGYRNFTGPGITVTDITDPTLPEVVTIPFEDYLADPTQYNDTSRYQIGINLNRSATTMTSTTIRTPDDLIGKTVFIDYRNYTITGIIDTGFDESRYADLTAADFDTLRANVLEYERQYGLACAAFVAPAMIATIDKYHPAVTTVEGLTFTCENEFITFQTNTVGRYSSVDWDALQISWIGDKLILTEDNQLVDIKGEAHTDIKENEFIACMSHTYHDNYNSSSPDERFVNLKMTATYDDEHNRILGSGYSRIGNIQPRTALGAYLYPIGSFVLVSDDLYEELTEGREGRYAYAVSALPKERPAIADFTQSVATDRDGIRYNLSSGITYEIAALDEIFLSLANIFRYVGLALAVFAFAMLWHFTGDGIHRRRRPIGIMRAMGAGGWDVGRIFLGESLILGLGSAILTGVLLTGAAMIGNRLIQAEFGILTSLLTVGLRQILLIFGLSLLVTTLASLIPTARLAAQKPIDVIRG